MAKFPKYPKLSKKETEEIVMDLCQAIAATHNSKEAAQLLTDLLGRQELEMIARRLKIAELLIADHTYDGISRILHVSTTTIARVHTWLQEAGEGYRLILERTKRSRREMADAEKAIKLSSIKRRYPIYFWPEIILKEWIKHSTRKEKETMKKILNKIGTKHKLYAELSNLLKFKE